MTKREAILAMALVIAAALVTAGTAVAWGTAVALIVGGILLAVLAVVTLAEVI